MGIIISDKYMNQIDNLYRANSMSELTELSINLLKKYKNNRSKTMMIMNRYKKRRDLMRKGKDIHKIYMYTPCLLYTSPSPRDLSTSRMPSSA